MRTPISRTSVAPTALRPAHGTASPASPACDDASVGGSLWNLRDLTADAVDAPKPPRRSTKPRPWGFRLAFDRERGHIVRVLPRSSPSCGYIVRVVTATTVTTSETVTESFLCDEEGEWTIVSHAPRVETHTRTVYDTVDYERADAYAAADACHRVMERPTRVGPGDLAMPRGVRVVGVTILARMPGLPGVADMREVLRLDRAHSTDDTAGAWVQSAVGGGDVLAAALARARAAFEAERSARVQGAATQAPASPPSPAAQPSQPAASAPMDASPPAPTAPVTAAPPQRLRAPAVAARKPVKPSRGHAIPAPVPTSTASTAGPPRGSRDARDATKAPPRRVATAPSAPSAPSAAVPPEQPALRFEGGA